jgi:uncharacterized protein (TIGR02145 family)
MAKYSLAHLIGCSFTTITNLKYHKIMLRILPFLLLPLLGMAQTNSKVEMPMGENTTSEKHALEIKRNAFYNLEELKVRWKKAALENCPGVPCVTVTVPGSPTIVNVVAGNAQATVSFTAPSSAGGSAITSYTVTSTPAVGPGTWTGAGPSITATGLTNGTPYTFTVVATNAVGNSLPSAASSAVTPVAACSAGAASYTATLTVGTVLTPNITHATTSATGIGTATGLPAGVNYAWSGNVITISGTPSVTGTFIYTIPLTGTSCSSVNATGTITVSAPSCGLVTSVTIDGYSYPTVSIGTQCWTNENLRVRRYSDGTEIRFDKSGTTAGTVSQTWSGTGLNYGAYTLYAHDSVTTPSSNLSNYGYLYNWYAVKGIITDGGPPDPTKNICPSGWHVPTDDEWSTLESYLNNVAPLGSVGGKMKSPGTTLWSSESLGTNNSSGFSALPGGYRISDGSFSNVKSHAWFWSATEFGASAWRRGLTNISSNVFRNYNNKSTGASVRCLKD